MYCASASVDKLVDCMMREPIGPRKGLMVFVAAKNKPDLKTLVAKLNEKGILFCGGVFPGVIEGGQSYETGVVACVVPMGGAPAVVENLGSASRNSLCASLNHDIKKEKQTALVLLDGLSSGIDRFLADLFHRFGHTVNYIGGGCGSLALQHEPCVFSNEGVFQDAAVVSFISGSCGMGVRHGWHKLMGPVVATHTAGNRIFTLNWEDAYTGYRAVIREDSGEDLTRENFYRLAMQYPFGIIKDGCEIVVRDAIMLGEKNELICCGEVPENAVLSILKGDRKSLPAAARQAARDAVTSDKRNAFQKDRRQVIVFDCISRTLYLGEAFATELASINDIFCQMDGMNSIAGSMSFGEIALSCNGSLEFHNKTTVVGLINE